MLYLYLLLQLLLARSILAIPYVVTSYIEVEVTVFSGFTYYGTGSESASPIIEQDRTITTKIVTVSPTGLTAPTGITTFTEKGHYTYLSVVDVVLPKGVAVPIKTTTYNTSNVVLKTSFYVPVTYEPFSTCSGKEWTYATTVPIYVPPPAQPYLTPLIVRTKNLDGGSLNQSTTLTTQPSPFVSALLNPTDVPAAEYSSASSVYQPDEVTICRNPTESPTRTRDSALSTTTETAKSSSIQCGKSNPQCQDCTYYEVYCIGNGCTAEDGSYYQCQDGKKHYERRGSHVNAFAIELAIPLSILGLIIIGVCVQRQEVGYYRYFA